MTRAVRLPRLPLRALAVVALLCGALLSTLALPHGVPSAAAASSGYCPVGTGTTVIVDFTGLGGKIYGACYFGTGTGWDALVGTGFHPVSTLTNPGSFVCRLSGLPANPPETCAATPPTTAYWSYWYAKNGGTWTYSSTGAASHSVIPGGFEGWSFSQNGKTVQPGIAPTIPAPPQPSAPRTSALGPADATSATARHSSTASAKSSRSPTATATTSSTPTAATDTSTSAGPLAAQQLPGDGPSGGRSPWPFVLGAVAVLLLLGGGYLVVQRRRVGGAPAEGSD